MYGQDSMLPDWAGFNSFEHVGLNKKTVLGRLLKSRLFFFFYFYFVTTLGRFLGGFL